MSQSSSPDSQSFDIAVIGGGINGLAMAMALSGLPLRIALVDAGPLASDMETISGQYDPRVCALTESSRQLLDEVGAWALMRNARVSPYTGMTVWDADGTGNIHFTAGEAGLDTLGHIVENRVTTSALLQRLSETDVTLLGHTEIASLCQTDDGVQLNTQSGDHLQSRLVIAADGAHSPIRRMAGIPTREWDYQHHAIVTTVQTEQYHQDTAWQIFLPSGPLAFLPLPSDGDTHYCSIVWSLVPEQAQQMMTLTDDAFCRKLGTAFEHRLGQVLSTDKRYCVPLRQRHARQYYRGRIVVMGDAAHTIHPLAGQGVNLGLLDARQLSGEIHRACERGGDYADALLLARYQRHREPHNLAVMGIMQGFQQLFGSDHLLLRWMRNTGLSLTNQIPFLKEQIIRQVMNP
ncbi:FAD-dependent monooxygenase [Kistimonas asteriae]|uniref:FAD-dependent monooxygenase n=1 Tax=Kistimonas asteriae TaxID=517724 RepID=UPI001BA4B1D8|nr:FAD-dependent monooxygenase [Kistimonas asteriae]